MDEEKEPADDSSEEGPIPLVCSDRLGFTESFPEVSTLKKKFPYLSNVSLNEGGFVPQLELEITANDNWLNSKLQALSQFSEEVRGYVRMIAALILVIALGTGHRVPLLVNIFLTCLSILLFIIASLSFRMVISAEVTKLNSETPPAATDQK